METSKIVKLFPRLMETSSKKFKPSDDEDWISTLSVDLTCKILSLLPTKDAVATCVLSKNWKTLWTSIKRLDFDNHMDIGYYHCDKGELEKKKIKFIQFVRRAMHQTNNLDSFRLNFDSKVGDPSLLNVWISFAIDKNVLELDLNLIDLEEPVLLPLTKSEFKNLTVLKLQGEIDFKIHASVCFPSLQSLDLREVAFEISGGSCVSFPKLNLLKLWHVLYANDASIGRLFSSCPVLDQLEIVREDDDDLHNLIIHIPSLTRLVLCSWCSNNCSLKVDIDTPALQYLHLEESSDKREMITVRNLSSLLEANVRFAFYATSEVVNVNNYGLSTRFMKHLWKVECLSLSGHSLRAIRIASENIVTGFHNVTWVELEKAECLDLKVVITNLLPIMDNLKHLIMKGDKCDGRHRNWWVKPHNVPKCLLFRLTNISFADMNFDYYGCGDEFELLQYLLSNSRVLQMLQITNYDSDARIVNSELMESKLPKGSSTCKVEITKLQRTTY